MDIVDILRQMERNDGYFARAAVTEALARRDEIVPELLRIPRSRRGRPATLRERAGLHGAHLRHVPAGPVPGEPVRSAEAHMTSRAFCWSQHSDLSSGYVSPIAS
jgi:hypothetical protein